MMTMTTLKVLLGFLFGMSCISLTVSVLIALYARSLLERCKNMLDFTYYLGTRCQKQMQASDKKQEAGNERTSISETNRV